LNKATYLPNGRHDLSLWLKDKVETLFIETQTSSPEKLIWGKVNKVPSFLDNDYLDTLEGDLSRITSVDKKMVLMGDFTIDLLNSDGRDGLYNLYNV